MKISFLEKNGSDDKLILVFPGWSCGRELYDDFHFDGWDIAIVENYEDAGLDISPLAQYSTIYLFAWSLGVFMASIADFKGLITSAFALNGTEMPANDEHGISVSIFKKTADSLTPASLLKFRRRMAGSANVFNELFKQAHNDDETGLLKRQLFSILEWQEEKPRFALPWRKVFLSENDAIFPFENLRRFWEEKRGENNIDIVNLEGAHFFPMEEIIRISIPDTKKLSERFTGAKSSYDSQAIAQKKLALCLCELLKESGLKKGCDLLEVGSGTGLLTKELVKEFSPNILDLVDISDVKPEIADVPFSFYQADAEEWIATTTKSYDAVVSSATIQWFINLPLFIKNVAGRLNNEGIFGFSTFLPGNLEELDPLRPTPLHYHSQSEITEWMMQYFDNIAISTSVFKLNFKSPGELLRHLKETGVAGSAPKAKIALSKIREISTLTFHCICVTGVKKKSK